MKLFSRFPAYLDDMVKRFCPIPFALLAVQINSVVGLPLHGHSHLPTIEEKQFENLGKR